MTMTGGSAEVVARILTEILVVLLLFLACAAAHQAARRKGRTLAWQFAAFAFPPLLLLLELLPAADRPPAGVPSNPALELAGAFVALVTLIVLLDIIAIEMGSQPL